MREELAPGQCRAGGPLKCSPSVRPVGKPRTEAAARASPAAGAFRAAVAAGVAHVARALFN